MVPKTPLNAMSSLSPWLAAGSGAAMEGSGSQPLDRKRRIVMAQLALGGEQDEVCRRQTSPLPPSVGGPELHEGERILCPFVSIIEHQLRAETPRQKERGDKGGEPRTRADNHGRPLASK
jgi:hypothetical protein